MSELRNFRHLRSKTAGHPKVDVTPGVETTTGPLGQGLANAVGMALSEKLLAAEFNRPGHPLVDHRTGGCRRAGTPQGANPRSGASSGLVSSNPNRSGDPATRAAGVGCQRVVAGLAGVSGQRQNGRRNLALGLHKAPPFHLLGHGQAAFDPAPAWRRQALLPRSRSPRCWWRRRCGHSMPRPSPRRAASWIGHAGTAARLRRVHAG